MHQDLKSVAEDLGISLPSLAKAYQSSQKDLLKIKELLLEEYPYQGEAGQDPKNADVVLLGSCARCEATAGSDCDYFILQNDASPDVSRSLIKATEKVIEVLSLARPGAQGVFGTIVVAANLYESLGLESDTNVNLTRRLLLLTESTSAYSEETYNSVYDKIILRYNLDYFYHAGEDAKSAKVPRLPLNDLVRYWRTIAVDFGAKRWRSLKDDSYLRHAKLRTTRKVLFAGPLTTLLLVPERVMERSGYSGQSGQ